MIIDTHAHIFPDKIAAKASDSISKFYDIPMDSDGTVSTLLELGREAGVDRFVVHSVATVPGQVEHINDFIMKSVNEYPDKLIGFATLHPDYDNIPLEVDRIIAGGLKGIKLHPDFQNFLIDEERAYAIYECVEGRLPILFHMGDSRYEYSKPQRLANILQRFPKLTVIGAHFAGYSEWDMAAEILKGYNIYVDTSSSLFKLTPEQARRLIDIYGVDHVLFASDYPMWKPADELKKIARIQLSQEEREQIFYKNALRLFGN